METTPKHDKRIAEMIFAEIYPLYLNKIVRKGRTEEELIEVIEWLTGFDKQSLENLRAEKVTYKTFFDRAELNPKAESIRGVVCGYRIENIQTPLTKKARYLDKIVDELAKGRTLDKIKRLWVYIYPLSNPTAQEAINSMKEYRLLKTMKSPLR